MLKDWYSPGAVWRWRRNHLLFVARNINSIRQAEYPANISGYSSLGVPIQNKVHDPTRIMDIAAEFDRRIKSCGDDGKLVMRVVADGWDAYKLAELFHVNESRIWRRINRALRYCRGRDFNRPPYRIWKREKHY